jgi:hypothetical protein
MDDILVNKTKLMEMMYQTIARTAIDVRVDAEKMLR